MMRALCLTPGSCVADAAGSLLGGLVGQVQSAVGETLTELLAWWTKTGPLDLDQPFVHGAQRYVTIWVAVPVAVLAICAAIAWGVVSGGAGWVADLGRGLLVFGVTATASIPIIIALQNWSTALAAGLLDAVPSRDVGARITGLLVDSGSSSPIVVLIWGGIILVAGVAQYIVMLFLDDAVLVLTVAIPLAAAGQFNRGSLLWLPRIVGWLVAFIFLKPTAALVYYLGLTLLGQGQGLHALASAACMMITAVLALPALLRLVSFATTPPPSGNALGTATTGASLAASLAQLAAHFR